MQPWTPDTQRTARYVAAHQARDTPTFATCVTEHMLLSGVYWGLNTLVW